jgi:hypothetical protein
MPDACEHVNEPLCFIKYGEYVGFTRRNMLHGVKYVGEAVNFLWLGLRIYRA